MENAASVSFVIVINKLIFRFNVHILLLKCFKFKNFHYYICYILDFYIGLLYWGERIRKKGGLCRLVFVIVNIFMCYFCIMTDIKKISKQDKIFIRSVQKN